MTKRLILFVVVAILLTSCGLSEEARELEEVNLELANRLRRAESSVIPAMQDHIDNLEDVVNTSREVQNRIGVAQAAVAKASDDLDAVVASIPETTIVNVETVLPEQLPATGEGGTPQGLLNSQRDDIERTHRHNQDAGVMREIVNKLDEIDQSLAGAEDNLQSASESSQEVTDAISDEIVEIADTTEMIAEEIADASALADDAAARARSIRDKADVANIVGGALATALGSLPIPGAKAFVGALPQADQVISRSPYDVATMASSGDSGGEFPYWLIPILLGGTGAPLLSRKVRGGVGKVFGKGKQGFESGSRSTVGPGQSSDARFLGEALMRLEAQDQPNRDAVAGPDIEDKLAVILQDRRRRRQVDDVRIRSIDQKPPIAPRGENTLGQSGVYSMPTDRVG